MRSPLALGSAVMGYIANRAGSSAYASWAVLVGAAEAVKARAAVAMEIKNFILIDDEWVGGVGVLNVVDNKLSLDRCPFINHQRPWLVLLVQVLGPEASTHPPGCSSIFLDERVPGPSSVRISDLPQPGKTFSKPFARSHFEDQCGRRGLAFTKPVTVTNGVSRVSISNKGIGVMGGIRLRNLS